MTQRRAVFVGCKLMAVYMVMEAAAAIAGSMMSVGWIFTTTGGAGRGGGGMPTEYVVHTMVVPALGKAGLAVFLWALSGGIARAAAVPEDNDDL